MCLLDNPQASLWAFVKATLEIEETAISKPVQKEPKFICMAQYIQWVILKWVNQIFNKIVPVSFHMPSHS